ncbi:Amd2p [Saccharomyces cerevisiae YJM1478]|nr:Amd2p [Saccharomyces cerevisiae YJM1311]AJV15350.1 Amd2p [Saccharomyces cerevisiae YJM1478]KAF4006495.1 Amidase family protein [Saccharomyces cerevisiae]CAI4933975.1 BBT_HP_G0033800.mRNA.1.CDS.1 [Saccharomyces cerevisiae]CAI4980769.1 BBT_HP_G0003640.mRNA.1.CDS.1 [Saccharomyces cerevisiae]
MTVHSTWKEKVQLKKDQLNSKIKDEWKLNSTTITRLKNDKKNLIKNIDDLCSSSENQITHSTIMALRQALEAKELSCHEITAAFCHRAALIHQVVNCLSEIMFSEALRLADYYDSNRPAILPPLYGIPISLKDQCNVEGVDTSLGYLCRTFKPKTKNEESLIVSFLRDLGAIIFVKTTVPSSMMATDTQSNTFGYTYNSINLSFSSGGSSGGEGSLIGAHGSLLGLGTDIGGSIRIPSSYQGLFGLKPTFGRVPYLRVDNSFEGRETIPSVIGPLARDLSDLRYFMSCVINICQPWVQDVKCIPYHFDSSTSKLHDNYVVGIWYGDGVIDPPPSDIRALKTCEDLVNKTKGMKAVKWEPSSELSRELFDLANEADVADSGNEIKNEFKVSGEPLLDILKPMVLENGRTPYTVNEWWDLTKRVYNAQQLMRDYYLSFPESERPDVIISPTTLMPFRPGDMLKTTLRYILLFNVLNFPSLSIPVGSVDCQIDGLMDPTSALNPEDKMIKTYWNDLIQSGEIDGFPIGLQVVSPTFNDNEVCKFASWLFSKI